MAPPNWCLAHSRLANLGYSFFLISFQQTTFCLLHVKFTRPYLEYFFQSHVNPGDGSSRECVEGRRHEDEAGCSIEDQFLTVYKSESLQLESREARVEAAEMILAMCLLLKRSCQIARVSGVLGAMY